MDANAANSPSVKAFKTALSDIKNEIIDVSIKQKHTIKIPFHILITPIA